jgi:hypothetical protein
MRVYRNTLMAGAAMLAFGLAQSASADPVTLNPSSTNGSTGFVIDGSGPFSTDGGYGTAYQSMYIATTSPSVPFNETPTGTGTGQSFDTNVVVSIGSFYLGGSAVGGTGIGTDWSLIAVVQMTGAGNWNPTDDFTATTADMSMQIYAVKGAISGETNPGGTFVTPGTTNSLTNAQFGTQLGLSGVGSAGGPSASACVSGSGSPAGAKCILLAYSSSTSGNALNVNGTSNKNDSETFSIAGVLDPLSYAVSTGLSGFFEGPTGFDMTLTVNSGDAEDLVATPITVSTNEINVGYTTGNCDFTPTATTCGQAVNWSIDVPEPASLTLLGTALAFVGGAVRRRRKARS